MTPGRPTSPTRIGWLRGLEIPSEWTESKVKYVAPGMQAGETITAESIEPVGTYPVYGGNGLRGYTEDKTHEGTCILIGRQGALCGNVHLVSGEFWASEHAIVALPADEVEPRWLAHLLQVMNLGQYSQTAAQPGIGTAQINALPVPVPPRSEQRAIADYLDRETARIDTLIEEQQRLIEMLRERRLEVVADAVTHGVDSADLSPSRVKWIGSVPRHWKSGQIKHVGNVTLGKMLQSANSGTDVRAPYMRAANVQPDGLLKVDDMKEMWFKPGELQALDLRAGDVVVVEGGVGGFGRAAYLSEDLTGWGFQNSINRIRPTRDADGRYIAYFLLMARAKGFIMAYCNIVAMPHLTAEKLNSLPIPIPPLDEQRRIANFLDKQTSKIDALTTETERFIELSTERRSALITAAVTGQIDVREAA